MSKTLFMTIRKEPFLAIKNGIKKEEYRDIKEYYINKFDFNKYDYVILKNGYSATAPQIKLEVKNIRKGYSNPAWCGGFKEFCYIIELGELIESK